MAMWNLHVPKQPLKINCWEEMGAGRAESCDIYISITMASWRNIVGHCGKQKGRLDRPLVYSSRGPSYALEGHGRIHVGLPHPTSCFCSSSLSCHWFFVLLMTLMFAVQAAVRSTETKFSHYSSFWCSFLFLAGCLNHRFMGLDMFFLMFLSYICFIVLAQSDFFPRWQ